MATTLIEDAGPQPPRKAKTTLVDHAAGKTRLVAGVGGEAAEAAAHSRDPVVGWLVVVAGPGRGAAVALGHGMNSIGRGTSNRVVLDFGDEQISSDDHFRIAYDHESRDFHLVPAKGTNLLYVGGKALLAPIAIEGHTDIRLGSTVLRFVPLCGKDWDWSDAAT